jgi:hypothetical protein
MHSTLDLLEEWVETVHMLRPKSSKFAGFTAPATLRQGGFGGIWGLGCMNLNAELKLIWRILA